MGQTWWVQSLQMKYWSPVMNSLLGLGCRCSTKYIHCKFECIWRWNIRTSTYLLFFLFSFPRKKVKVMCFFFPTVYIYIYETSRMGEFWLWCMSAVLEKLPVLLLLVCAPGPFDSSVVNQTGRKLMLGQTRCGLAAFLRKHSFIGLTFLRRSGHKRNAVM